MSGKKQTKTSRMGWPAMHCGFILGGLCLLVLAEDHREGKEESPARAEKPPHAGQESGDAKANRNLAWLDSQIEALGDPLYGVRAKATRKLQAAGASAVERLSLALRSRDPEIARRSHYILSQLIRSDHASFVALEQIAGSPEHPSSKIAKAIYQNELERRERLWASLAEHRQLEAQKLLREARAELYQSRFADAREKSADAQALNCTYNLFDDRPDLVLDAIHQAEARAAASKPLPQITAERDSSQVSHR